MYIIYIYDLSEQALLSVLLLYADDVQKCFKSICDSSDHLQLQNDINLLYSL